MSNRIVGELQTQATVEERVPYYGEYMIRNDEDDWVFNEKYQDSQGDRSPYEYSDDGTEQVEAMSD